eukprot:TRINITY_DN15310_c0_g1_i1.p1 TRINITY_DN15310_c0_g1~~TRINITY_DN15310_c0_g1_i1.p1  ORF type:complete len:206 (+),score=76.11 TRINITY_DN15310_c0_g1_i1:157-774(+)
MGRTVDRVEKVCRSVHQQCLKAEEAIARWVQCRDQLLKMLESLSRYLELFDGDVSLACPPETHSAYGCLTLLPGCVEGVQVATVRSINKLVEVTKEPMEAMAAVANALQEHYTECMKQYMTAWQDPALHGMYAATSAPVSDYLSCLKQAALAYRLQYAANRDALAFSAASGAFAQLRAKVAAARQVVQEEHAVDPAALYLIYPSV